MKLDRRPSLNVESLSYQLRRMTRDSEREASTEELFLRMSSKDMPTGTSFSSFGVRDATYVPPQPMEAIFDVNAEVRPGLWRAFHTRLMRVFAGFITLVALVDSSWHWAQCAVKPISLWGRLALNALHLFVVLARFNTSLVIGMEEVTDRPRIAKHVLRSPTFFLDLASFLYMLPVCGLLPIAALRCWRFAVHDNFARLTDLRFWLAQVLLCMVMVAHILACVLVKLDGGAGADYTQRLYEALLLLSQYKAPEYGELHVAVTCAMVVIGLVFFAWILAALVLVIEELQQTEHAHWRQVMRLQSQMRALGVPGTLEQRVLSYKAYRHARRNTTRSLSSAFDDLSAPLQVELQLFLNSKMVLCVPMFSQASPGFVKCVVQALESNLYLPGDFIVCAGDAGKEMYFLAHGEVEVLASQNGAVGKSLVVLKPGTKQCFFGEMALLTKQKRMAFVRANLYSTCSRLPKEAFEALLRDFPEDSELIRAQALERQKSNSVIQNEGQARDLRPESTDRLRLLGSSDSSELPCRSLGSSDTLLTPVLGGMTPDSGSLCDSSGAPTPGEPYYTLPQAPSRRRGSAPARTAPGNPSCSDSSGSPGESPRVCAVVAPRWSGELPTPVIQ